MRWSIIRLIWFREMRDQLRDRRTLFMIAGLPLVLYPVLGFSVLTFALGFSERPSVIGVVTGPDHTFPKRSSPATGRSPLAQLGWLSATPFPSAGSFHVLGACALVHTDQMHFDYPSFIHSPGQAKEWLDRRLKLVYLDDFNPGALDERKVDLVLTATPDFFAQLEAGEQSGTPRRPAIEFHSRPDDESSRQAIARLNPFLEKWNRDLKRIRLARRGLPEHFVEPFEVRGSQAAKGSTTDNVLDLMPRLFPFMLVMWSLAGALYPAVDLCAGEKERGTMETLLITPAGREEIVLGKFLTIWVFSAGTALLNVFSMGITTWNFSNLLPSGALSLTALAWCVLLSLPQAAFFSAISLAIGAYARSSKEGQYYLMPLFLLTLPLIFLTFAPGVELNAFYSLVPVTGVALLMQKLMTATSVEQVPWLFFGPVLAAIGIYSWLALRWAIEQFHREEVLFREAERWDWKLWFQRLFREKEALPTTGEALFCFCLLLALRWLSLSIGSQWPTQVHASISALAFVAAPALFMALFLNTLPREALYLRAPGWREVGLAVVLTLLLLPPLTGLAQAVYTWFPQWLDDPQPLVHLLKQLHERHALKPGQLALDLFAFALLPAVCEELALRGFILSGLQRRFRPRNAVLLSSFLYALFHLNVFLFVPTFCLGVVLGLLTVRSRSLVPAIIFHFLYNAFLIGSVYVNPQLDEPLRHLCPWLSALCLAAALGLVWWLYRKPYADLERARRGVPPA